MKHYKVQFGYADDQYIPITGDELPKALAAFIEGNGKVLFQNGAVRAQDIMQIVPDWHAAFGWNKGYRMKPEDYSEIEPIQRAYQKTYLKAKAIAEYAVKNNKRELLSIPPAEAFKLVDPAVQKLLK